MTLLGDLHETTKTILADGARAFPGWESVALMLAHLHMHCTDDTARSRDLRQFLASAGAPFVAPIAVAQPPLPPPPVL